ncbi:MAG: hypothetical protein F2677_03300 [Actinobacteria bacterium]|nr:hypothetical protein [Actinomycetota bacterium]
MDEQLPPPPTEWQMWQVASPGRKAALYLLIAVGTLFFPPTILVLFGSLFYYRRKHQRIIRERDQ